MSEITQYIPDRNKKREYTEKQQSFLDNLVSAGGDAKIAADLAGYAPGVYPQVVRALKEEIIEQVQIKEKHLRLKHQQLI